MSQRYQLSPFYTLSAKKAIKTYLQHTQNQEIYLINSVTHAYLSFFAKKPITFLRSVELFAKKHNTLSYDVHPTVNRFFGDMFHQSILVQEEEHQHLLDFPAQKEAQEKSFLKPYTIKKILSQEYYLSIYLLENIETKALSIFKILHLNAFFSTENKRTFRRALLQEIEILEQVKTHPGIVKLLKYTDKKPVMTIESEYIDGVSLRAFIAQNLDLSFENRQKLFTNILEAYVQLHELDILHGDIHASNILVQTDCAIKLIDFDMAYHSTPKRGKIIHKGGVQNYIAPEKISTSGLKISDKQADFRSEVYQIGVIYHLIFMNKLPFEADSWKQLAAKIKKGNLDIDSSDLAQKYIDFLRRAMNKNPNERFATASEMNEAWKLVMVK